MPSSVDSGVPAQRASGESDKAQAAHGNHHLPWFGSYHGKSLEDVHSSVAIPLRGHWLRRMLAFAGPAYMVSVGYMDPGNWATDLAGGAKFGYALIWVLLMSNLMAVLLQTLSARLGLVTGRDLAQACRDSYNPVVRWILFLLCEIAIAACDLAEVLGTAIGLNLLTAQLGLFGGQGIPLLWAVVITGFDVFLLLAIQRFGIRKMEAFILMLVAIIGACFIVEIFLAKPDPMGIARGFVPGKAIFTNSEMLYIAIGILGATVMPHNLYLHSALVQSRDIAKTPEGLRQACKYNLIDSAVALNCAFFVNSAILVLSAAVFFKNNMQDVAEIQHAHHLLEGLLGTKVAPIAFAVALICAGQSSTITGTLAGQITMEGFLHFRIRPWLRRLITRGLAIIPAVIVIAMSGEHGTTRLLVLSQVILSLQLPFAVVPLVKFTANRKKMGAFATPTIFAAIAWIVAAIIIALNAQLVAGKVLDWGTMASHVETLGDNASVLERLAHFRATATAGGWAVLLAIAPITLGLLSLLLWMTFRPEHVEAPAAPAARLEVSADQIADAAAKIGRTIRRVGVALGAENEDAPMLAEAIALARMHGATLLLMHVVEGVGGQYHGPSADDLERRADQSYVEQLAARLRADLDGAVGAIDFVLGYGDVQRELVRLAREHQLDVLVMGGHGHRGVMDLLRGTTIDAVRHSLKIPILAVRDVPKG
jgi:manganese transport protein